ncbi:recombinase family protein [Isoptericola jiangsuensis]|uniref:recombinase family protein n=1 Tax=Isoptericola jiangsuensis TaxID=548579 RepID=UPI003AAB21C0
MRVVVYARLSVTTEESVSISRQIEAATKYADARGWEVLGEPFVDDGVSASKNKPEDRPAWRALLASARAYEAVLIWKVDRLARRVLDFLHADEALQQRGAGLVAVEDPIDMTTPQGRAFATMLAVFAEMEAAATRARVAAARRHLIRGGRAVGGAVPYGWRNVPNPQGPGMVVAKDPDRIAYVEGMAQRTFDGHTLYSTMQWLEEVGAPAPSGDRWHYSTVERLLRHPLLAGLTTFNPGNTDSHRRGTEVLRGDDGLPLVNEALAVLPLPRWRALVRLLDGRGDTSPQARPRAMRSKTSGVLSGLVWCGEHPDPVRMHRGTTQGRPSYQCPQCFQTVSSYLEECVVEKFLWAKCEYVRWNKVEFVDEGAAAMLPEIEARLQELGELITQERDRDARLALLEQVDALQELQEQGRHADPEVRLVEYGEAVSFDEAWASADDDTERRAVLGDAIERVLVRRGRPGRGSREKTAERLTFEWRFPEQVGPVEDSL